jgi:hypothetical protein
MPILTNGYQFVVISEPHYVERLVIYHSECEQRNRNGICLLRDLEPALFENTELVDAIYDGYTGSASYYEGDTKWYVSYTVINSTIAEGIKRLSVVGVVPYEDIEEDYMTLKKRAKSAGEYTLIACICVVVVMFVLIHHLSGFVFKALINPLHDFKSQANDFSDSGLEVELGNTSKSKSFKYKEMAKVKSSFQSLIYVLEDVNRQYFSNKLEVAYEQILLLENIFHEMENKAALGVILNNKGNILLKLFEIEDHEKFARDCFKESISIGHEVIEDFSKIDDEKKKTDTIFRFHTLTLAGRYCNIGNYYQLVRDLDAALAVYEMSIRLYAQAGDVVGKARATGIVHLYSKFPFVLVLLL